VANRLLADAQVQVPASRSARPDGFAPMLVRVPTDEVLSAAVEQVGALRRRHRLSGLIAPAAMLDALTAALANTGLVGVTALHHLGENDVPLIAAELAKGLELDGVVVVQPSHIHDGTPRGARLLYIAMTRAVQELVLVTSQPLPASIDAMSATP
jgi:superfamily I DNA/RNA helicase